MTGYRVGYDANGTTGPKTASVVVVMVMMMMVVMIIAMMVVMMMVMTPVKDVLGFPNVPGVRIRLVRRHANSV